MTSRNVGRTPIQLFMFALCCSLCAGTAWADGAVYAMTNALGNNQILVYHRASNGSLSSTPIQTIATGGGGSGLQLSGVDSLGSEGGVQLDQAHQLLFAVNTETVSANNGAGTYNQDCALGTITSFRVAADGTLTFADRVFSGGLFPDSLTVKSTQNGDLLWVLNAGGPGPCAIVPNITGFSVNAAGHNEFHTLTTANRSGPHLGRDRLELPRCECPGVSGIDGCSSGGFRLRLESALVSPLAGASRVHSRRHSVSRDGQRD